MLKPIIKVYVIEGVDRYGNVYIVFFSRKGFDYRIELDRILNNPVVYGKPKQYEAYYDTFTDPEFNRYLDSYYLRDSDMIKRFKAYLFYSQEDIKNDRTSHCRL